ncbi:MAG: phage holin family protein [Minisyncoccales bacterium]
MPTNNIPPNDFPQYIAILWVFILSVWGGTVHTIKKVRDKVIDRFTFREWVYDVITSGFIGFVTYAFCKYAGFDEWLTAVFIGIASHQGTRGLLLVEQWVTSRVGVIKVQEEDVK